MTLGSVAAGAGGVHRRFKCRLTVKLKGGTEAPHGAEGAQFLSARGAKPNAHHGPLQRLLDGEPSFSA